MAKDKGNITTSGFNEVIAEIQSFGKALTSSIAKYSEIQVSNMYQDVLYRYYADYTPKRYERTRQLLLSSFEPYSQKSKNGYRWFAGVLVTPGKMRYETGYSSEQVIEDYMEGWHGGEWHGIRASFTPYTVIYKQLQDLVNEICYGNTKYALISEAVAETNPRILKIGG